ncbi:MAG: hypothetical protein U1D30_07615 [Planctomycetota bacterium]
MALPQPARRPHCVLEQGLLRELAGDLSSVCDVDDPPIQFIHLADSVFDGGINPIEAKRMAELIAHFFLQVPGLQSWRHRLLNGSTNRILDELDVLRRVNPELESCLDEESPERFFVKNLENVQGDERASSFWPSAMGEGPTGQFR